MSLTFAKASSIAKKGYFFEVISKGRNNYSMVRRVPGSPMFDMQMDDMKKQEVVEMVEAWEEDKSEQ